MKLFPRDGFWWFDVTTEEEPPKRIRRTTGIRLGTEEDRSAAWSRATQIMGSRADAARRVTLSAALRSTYDSHWSRLRSAQAMNHMVDVLTRQLGHHDIDKLTYPVLKDYCDSLLREGYAPATVNRRMAAISVTLREQARRGALRSRPEIPHFTENNKRERYVSLEEEKAILEWLLCRIGSASAMKDTDAVNEWQYLHSMTVFLFDTGFRFSELFKFDVAGGMASLKHGTTKNTKGRSVPLTDRACLAAGIMLASPVHAWLTDMGPERAWPWVSHRWSQAAKAASCPDVTLHILRHTCAARLIQRGVSIFLVSKWLGHSSVKVTERYLHLAPDSLSQALAALQGGPVSATPREALPVTQSSPYGRDSTEPRHAAKG
jgi:site-specific recombinase XerD